MPLVGWPVGRDSSGKMHKYIMGDKANGIRRRQVDGRRLVMTDAAYVDE